MTRKEAMETIELEKNEVALIFKKNELKVQGDIDSPSGTAAYAFLHRAAHDPGWIADQKEYLKKHSSDIQKEIESRLKEERKQRTQKQLFEMESVLIKVELIYLLLHVLPKEDQELIQAELEESEKEIEVYRITLKNIQDQLKVGLLSEVRFLAGRFLLKSLESVILGTFDKLTKKLEANHIHIPIWHFQSKRPVYA